MRQNVLTSPTHLNSTIVQLYKCGYLQPDDCLFIWLGCLYEISFGKDVYYFIHLCLVDHFFRINVAS